MSNDDKKVDEVHETTSEEPIENEAHEEMAEFEDTINKISEKDIYKELKQRIPKYMLPKEICILDDIPLNVNGKIDRVYLKKLK